MANKEKKIEGRLGYNSENGRYGLLISDLWEHTGFHCGECLEVNTNLHEIIQEQKAKEKQKNS